VKTDALNCSFLENGVDGSMMQVSNSYVFVDRYLLCVSCRRFGSILFVAQCHYARNPVKMTPLGLTISHPVAYKKKKKKKKKNTVETH
jgi:hypothetical protein